MLSLESQCSTFPGISIWNNQLSGSPNNQNWDLSQNHSYESPYAEGPTFSRHNDTQCSQVCIIRPALCIIGAHASRSAASEWVSQLGCVLLACWLRLGRVGLWSDTRTLNTDLRARIAYVPPYLYVYYRTIRSHTRHAEVQPHLAHRPAAPRPPQSRTPLPSPSSIPLAPLHHVPPAHSLCRRLPPPYFAERILPLHLPLRLNLIHGTLCHVFGELFHRLPPTRVAHVNLPRTKGVGG